MLKYPRQLFADWRQRRRHRRIRRSSLADLAEGTEVRVVGIARPHGTVLEAPVSRRICVCYAILIYDWHHDGSVRVVHTEQGRMPFELVEADRQALIEPSRAQMSALFDHQRRVEPATNRDMLERLDIESRDWSQTRVLEVEEAIIELDERIAVIGTATREPDPDAAPNSYRDSDLPTRIRIHPTAISDDPRLFR